MKKSDELKQLRAAKMKEQSELIATSKTEKREFSDSENSNFDSLQSEIDAFDGQIERAVRIELAEARNAERSGVEIEKREEVLPGVSLPPFSIHRAIRGAMQNGILEGAEKESHEAAKEQARAFGGVITGIGISLTRAAQSVTGDAGAKGGNLVATDLQAPIAFLRPEPLMEKMGASYITNLTGNLRFPKNEGGIVAVWEGETEQTPTSANVYGYINSIPKRLSVSVPISLQNLMQSSVDLEAYTISEINSALANALDAAAVNGAGINGNPLGILNDPGINVVPTAADGSAPNWDMIVDAETNVFVANANASKMAYLMNPKTRGRLKKTKHGAGDLNYVMGTDNTINGYNSGVSNHVPSNLTKGTGTNLSALLFGDFSQLLINQWGVMDLSVDQFSQKANGMIVVTVNVFADVLVKQPKSFSVVKGLITV